MPSPSLRPRTVAYLSRETAAGLDELASATGWSFAATVSMLLHLASHPPSHPHYRELDLTVDGPRPVRREFRLTEPFKCAALYRSHAANVSVSKWMGAALVDGLARISAVRAGDASDVAASEMWAALTERQLEAIRTRRTALGAELARRRALREAATPTP